MPTIRDALNRANANDVPARLRQLWDETNSVGFGDMLAALRPRNRTLSGLTSGTTHVHDQASIIFNVETPVGTNLLMISGGTPGAGEVSVDYDAATGVPTLEFNGAVTTYTVAESGPLPQNIAAQMAAAS